MLEWFTNCDACTLLYNSILISSLVMNSSLTSRTELLLLLPPVTQSLDRNLFCRSISDFYRVGLQNLN